MAQDKSESVPAGFKPGDKVRVKYGVLDPDFPDIPLGGWAGTVTGVELDEDETLVTIAWNRATLRDMPQIFKNRCERDGLEMESMCLGEKDLEIDDGTRVPIEQPTAIVTQPLSEKDDDDRIRMALGLTHDDPIPEVTEETLRTYHSYLKARLKFPLQITFWEETGPFSRKKVTVNLTELADPQADCIDEGYGLTSLGHTPKGEAIEVRLDEIAPGKKDPNVRLLDDYCCWFNNWR